MGSQSALFGVVDVEEEADFVWLRGELRNIGFVEFLVAVREFADQLALEFVVPTDDFFGVFGFALGADPVGGFVVARAGGDKLFEGVGCDAGELPKELRETTGLIIVFAIDASEEGAAFYKRAFGNDITAEFFVRTRWRLLAEVLGERLDFGCVQVWGVVFRRPISLTTAA
jgi:hypothetical protein